MIDVQSVGDLARAALDELLHHIFPGATVHQPAPRCFIGEHPATPGRLLCDGHLQKLSAMLRDIEEEAIHLSSAPSIAVAYDRGSGSGAPAFERSPVRTEVTALVDRRRGTGVTRGRDLDETAWDDTPSVLESLHSWARLVRAERYLTIPTTTVVLHRWTATHTGPVCWRPPLRSCTHASCAAAGTTLELAVTDTVLTPPTVTGERDLLTRQLDWIATRPWVDDLYQDMSNLLTALRRANNTLDVPVGKCDDLRPAGQPCEGSVWHVHIRHDGKIARGNPGPDDTPGFRCSGCRRIWTGTDAVRKRDRMWRAEQQRQASGTDS